MPTNTPHVSVATGAQHLLPLTDVVKIYNLVCTVLVLLLDASDQYERMVVGWLRAQVQVLWKVSPWEYLWISSVCIDS